MRNFPSTPRPFIWHVPWRSISSLQIRFASLLPVHQPTFRAFPSFLALLIRVFSTGAEADFAFHLAAAMANAAQLALLPLLTEIMGIRISTGILACAMGLLPPILTFPDWEMSYGGLLVVLATILILDCFDKNSSRRRRFSVAWIRLRFAFAYERQRDAGTHSLARLWDLEIQIRLSAPGPLGRSGNRSGDVDAVDRPQLPRVSALHPISYRFRAGPGGIEQRLCAGWSASE
jgi:hypothetical protein